MTSPYWTVMNDLDGTITNYLTVRDLIRDNTEDPEVLDMAVNLLEHFIDKQDKAFKKAWTEVVSSTTESIQDKKYSAQYTDEELDAMCDAAASQQDKEQCYEYNLREAEYYNQRAYLDLNPMLAESKEQIYKNYRAAIDEYNKLNDKYKDLEQSHEELQDLFYRVDAELDELKVKYEQCQKNYHTVVNNVMNSKSDKIDLDLYP